MGLYARINFLILKRKKSLLVSLFNFLINIRSLTEKKIEIFGEQSFAFAIFGLVNYPVFYIIWRFYALESYENLILRVIATAMCLVLILKKYWPNQLKPWFPLYWYLTLAYCLPFFFTFMMLKNNGSPVWLMSSNVVIFWLILLVDWIVYLIILFIGVFFANLFYVLATANSYTLVPNWSGILMQYAASFFVIVLITHFKERIRKEKYRAMQSIATSIAHEIRTPLSSINLRISGIRNRVLQLFDNEAKRFGSSSDISREKKTGVNEIIRSVDAIHFDTKSANSFVNIMLMNLRPMQLQVTKEEVSIRECIIEALSRYPFQPGEKKKIQFEGPDDFIFMGQKELMVHVFFNLIKNSLYYIAVRPGHKGHINIRITQNKDNKVYFRDNGEGISEADIKHIFERFYSKTYHGAGIGLAYCREVVERFGGKISCRSILGEYTEFIIQFPKIKKEDLA